MRLSRITCALVVIVATLLTAGRPSVVRAAGDGSGLREQALKLNTVTGTGPMAGEVQVLVEDAAGTKKLLAVAVSMAKDKDQPFNLNAALILARTAQNLKEVEASEVFYRLYADLAMKLESAQKLAVAYGGLIDLFYENKRFADSEKVCKEVLDMKGPEGVNQRLRGYKELVRRRMIQALAKQGKIDDALKMVAALMARDPDVWLHQQLKGWVEREAGRYEDAAKTFEEVLDRINKDKELSKEEKTDYGNELHYLLSNVYMDLDSVDKAAGHLKILLDQQPDNPTFNNDLGYVWADHDMNLEEAEKLIRKAIDEERKQIQKADPNLKPEEIKDNAAYLDSLGWVLFKQKKFKEAKKYLIRATKAEDGQHLEILDHLGDTQMALKEKAEAIAAWKQGIEVAGTTKRDQQRKAEVEKKLKAAEK